MQNDEITFNEVEIDKILLELENICRQYIKISEYYQSTITQVNRIRNISEVGKVPNLDLELAKRNSLIALYHQLQDAKEMIEEYANNKFYENEGGTFTYHKGLISAPSVENQMIKDVGECCMLSSLSISEQALSILDSIKQNRKNKQQITTKTEKIEEIKEIAEETGAMVIIQDDKTQEKEQPKTEIQQAGNSFEASQNTNQEPEKEKTIPQEEKIESAIPQNVEEPILKDSKEIEINRISSNVSNMIETQKRVSSTSKNVNIDRANMQSLIEIKTEESNTEKEQNLTVPLTASTTGVGAAGIGIKAYSDYRKNNNSNNSDDDNENEEFDDFEEYEDDEIEDIDDEGLENEE